VAVELMLAGKIETCPVEGCTNLNLHKFLSTKFNTDGCIQIRERFNLFQRYRYWPAENPSN
jgi:hypothetical protein